MATAWLIDSNNPEGREREGLTLSLPLRRMAYGARTNHVEIDVDHTAMQMLVGFDGRPVINVLPERPCADFPLVRD